MGMHARVMARAATTSDVFNAIAEPRRRQILTVLRDGEQSVNDLVLALGLEQPQVSKHLRVLREVQAVSVREDGRLRLYRLNGKGLKPVSDFISEFEKFWNERFDLMDALLAEITDTTVNDTTSSRAKEQDR
jgi:DNA-binding transcriptional ArsR family regulator